MSTITFVIFTYNEEKRIEYVVRNFIPYGEVIVMDDSSTDRTKEIVEQLGAQYVVRPKMDILAENPEMFAFVKEYVKTDWIYWGFADTLAPKSLLERMTAIAKEDKVKQVLIPLYTYLWGNTEHYALKAYIPMFFHKDFIDFSGNHIHGMGRFTGSTDQLLQLPNKEKYAMRHFSTYETHKFVTGHLRYAEIEAAEKHAAGKRFSALRMIAAMARDCWIYGKQSYRLGILGLIIVLHYVFFRLMAYAKLYELEHGITLETIENAYGAAKEDLLKEFK